MLLQTFKSSEVPLGTGNIYLATMVFLQASLLAFCVAASTVSATSSLPTSSNGPTVTLDQGTFIGTSVNGTNQFRGIPYAQPPSVVGCNSTLFSD